MSGKYNPAQLYVVSGALLQRIDDRLDWLTGGGNITRGPGVLVRGGGSAGVTIAARPAAKSPPVITAGGQRQLVVYDATDPTNPTVPRVGVTPGAVSNTVPTLDDNPINVLIGTPPSFPTLAVSTDQTLLYLQIDYDSGGNVLTVEIIADSSIPSATIVPGTEGTDYAGLSTIIVTPSSVVNGNIIPATVKCLNDYLGGSVTYSQCSTSSNLYLKGG